MIRNGQDEGILNLYETSGGKAASKSKTGSRIFAWKEGDFSMFTKILVAYDGSEISNKALDQGLEWVRTHPGTRLTVLHVYHFPAVVVGEAFVAATPDMNEAVYEEAEKVAELARTRIAESSVQAVVETLEAQPAAEAIIDYARKNQFELIIVGSRGLTGFKELMLGSVSHHVVQHSPVPVLVVK